jgi:hypothetical protein
MPCSKMLGGSQHIPRMRQRRQCHVHKADLHRPFEHRKWKLYLDSGFRWGERHTPAINRKREPCYASWIGWNGCEPYYCGDELILPNEQ